MPKTESALPVLKAFRIELPNDNLLQALRFVHALSEGDFDLCLKEETLSKMELLSYLFPFNIRLPQGDEVVITDFEINHETPLTRFGSILKPLIFPRAYFTYLRSIWNLDRTIAFSFCGLLTPRRIEALNSWLRLQNWRQQIPNSQMGPLLNALFRKINVRWPISRSRLLKFNTPRGSLLISSSDNGRIFPGKVWDDSYFRTLADSQFVLCPTGDYVWTYRFFEAIMCGAIPIVEKSCDSYRPFKFFQMDERITNMCWSRDIAEHNFSICRQYLTVSQAEMNSELAQMFP